MKTLKNPFPVSGYYGHAYFCDREDEAFALIRNVENGLNTTLVSIRRMGKTGLIYHVFHELLKKKEIKSLYVDLYATQSLKDMCGQLAAAMFMVFPEKQSAGKKFLKLLKGLSPVITYDPLTGLPEVHFEYARYRQYEHSLASLFAFLEEQDSHILVVMDEFQQIVQYPEKNTEALLRTLIQKMKNCSFIFSGSNRHLMSQIFSNQKRPFFASTQLLFLNAIPSEKYLPFIRTKFEEHKRTISDPALAFIGEWTRLHTWYTQVVSSRLFAANIRSIDTEDVKSVCSNILKESEGVFYQYRNLLTPAQWQFVTAIAKEEKLYQPMSKDFLQKYGIPTAGNIPRLLQSLMAKEMIYRAEDNGQSCYVVYDCFLSRWLEKC